MFGSESMGADSNVVRRFVGALDRVEVREQGNGARFYASFRDVSVLEVEEGRYYPFRTITIDMPWPTDKQFSDAGDAIPPRTAYGRFAMSVFGLYAPERVNLQELAHNVKPRMVVESVSGGFYQRDAEGNRTDEWISTLQWLAVALADGDGQQQAPGNGPVSQEQLVEKFLELVPTEGISITDLAQAYMGAQELRGKLDGPFFGQTLMPQLVAEGKVTLGEDELYRRVG